MQINQPITPCLWFNDEAEAAATFYVSIFENARIVEVSRYTEPPATDEAEPVERVMLVAFELNGQPFTALNGGPQFKFNEAVSFQIMCDTQAVIDYYWDKLGEGGDPTAQQCGWLKDKFGVSWQIVPSMIGELIGNPDPEKAQRATAAMLKMKKLDIEALRNA